MDVPLKQLGSTASVVVGTSFNPCFGGCSIKTPKVRSGLALDYVVSILVLVDVPLKLWTFILLRNLKSGFNPCFGGCSIKTGLCSNGSPRQHIVSILVLVDVPLKQVLQINSDVTYVVFQSLFWWMFH